MKPDEEDGYDTDETTSMPDLVEATDQELEDTVLQGTTFSQDELEYDRAALNVPSPLEEGEIIELPNIRRRLSFGQHTYTMIPEFNESVLLYGSAWLPGDNEQDNHASSASV